ncbi:uncharacterized protein [Parasteatoda tepidariorum]|uniref:uncharacterized protein n=1 Tax=Parasteatoda tepidariorum TaxID=114398 RepID=UPI001C71C37A|nr:uncharacterized protein LOC107449072 [Parasteatoda tepidariorum]
MSNNHTYSIKQVQTLKYLGILLDQALTWIPHLNQVKERVGNFNNLIKRVARATWRLKPKMLKTIYLRATERIILYAASVWYRNTNRINEKLNSIQRSSLILITKAYATTSTEALQILAKVEPIHLKVINDICVKRLRWQWRLEDFDSDIRAVLQAARPDCPPSRLHPSTFPSVPYGKSLPTNTGLEIFTDGSRMEVANPNTKDKEDRTGSGMIAKLDGETIEVASIRLTNNSSVYVAELVAIKKAISIKRQWLSDMDYPRVTIYSDSLSSLQALNNPKPISKLVEEIKLLWHDNIDCNWVKAHAGIQDNEEADRAAKEATSDCNISIEVPSSNAQIKTVVKSHNMSGWKREWQSSGKGRQTFKFFKDPKLNRLQANFYFNQFLTGHGVFGEHQSRLFNKNIQCNYCGEQQTIDHIIFSCSQFRTLRDNDFTNSYQHQCFVNLACRKIIISIIKQILEDVLGDRQ